MNRSDRNISDQPVLTGVASGSILKRHANGSYSYASDEVAVEEPLEIRIGSEPLAVTMRTPGHDEELATGLLLSEGIIQTKSQLLEIAHCQLPGSHGNVLNVNLAAGVEFDRRFTEHRGMISSSCGICGKACMEAIRQSFPAIERSRAARLEIPALLSLPGLLRPMQKNFARTGGIHAAAIFNLQGELCLVREDIGRHNAVDKALGRAFLDGLWPLHEHVLFVSGRVSFEIIQKALAAALPILAAVSAPSTLAVNFARENGQTLVGFLRPPTFNVYSHLERLIFP